MFASAPPVPAGMPAMRHPIRLAPELLARWRPARTPLPARCWPRSARLNGRRRGTGGGPSARTSRTRYRWPRVAADVACQTVPRALADTLPGRGPAGLAALIEGPATLILSAV